MARQDAYYNKLVNASIFITDSTKTTYIKNMKAITTHCEAPSIHHILHTPDTYGPCIKSLPKPLNTRFSYIVTVLAYLKYTGLKEDTPNLFNGWYKHFIEIKKELRAIELSNKPTARQAKATIPWATVIKKRNTLPYGSPEHLLLSIYTYVPPRRQLDYTQMRVYTDPAANPQHNHNFIHLYSNKFKSPYMLFSHYKTAKHHTRPFFNKEIPKELIDIIKRSLKAKPRNYLFTSRGGDEPYKDANSFQKYSNKILKKIFDNPYVSVNSLRHSYATYLDKLPNIDARRRQRDAMKMGHTLRKALEYVHKKEENPKPKDSKKTKPRPQAKLKP